MSIPSDASISLPTQTWLELYALLQLTPGDWGFAYADAIKEGLVATGVTEEEIERFVDSRKA